jgi:hypothetical protein
MVTMIAQSCLSPDYGVTAEVGPSLYVSDLRSRDLVNTLGTVLYGRHQGQRFSLISCEDLSFAPETN